MLFAPVLQDVAARMAGDGAKAGADPVQQAYRLRDAVELVRPDWVLSHHDPEAEAAAVRSAGADVELVDVSLAGFAPVSGLVQVVEILAKLYPDTVIAASLTGPAGLAAALDTDGEVDLLDCGDVLAELVSAYVGAGARRIVVWEPEVPGEIAAEATSAHLAIVRRLEMLGIPGVLCGASAVDSAGYTAHALSGGGREAMLVPATTFARGSVECFGELWQRWAALGAERAGLVLTDGPVPADCDMGLLSSVGARPGSGR
ncbi:hypothetical protein EV191_10561 [Tamaricihabitans halophyticus]|uniref:Uncharacterized protein n=1 Tax=Tamaricihabitans halophyticus TaxID=1262583 RepID=A0A4R2QSX5_9PSEU|nr:hypothetical protein [Tamaricihabitans halophyticus]TCP53000.1 hypothetical protein EV191_10561 [Tamaricihabitans halophyticus]